MRTKLVQDAIASGKPITARVTTPPLGAWWLTPAQGGVPIIRGGQVIAAVGAGGSPPPTDERIAQAGVDAVPSP